MTDHGGVHVHVHHVMAGSFPLRVADLLFADDAVLVPEYAHLTPLFGIATGRSGTAAESARDAYEAGGVDGLLALAETTREIPYDSVVRIRLYDPPWRGRPKVAIDVEAGPPHAYRVHAPVDVGALADALGSLGERRGFAVTRRDGLGLSLRASLRRFRADR